jgi:hypothetical protein
LELENALSQVVTHAKLGHSLWLPGRVGPAFQIWMWLDVAMQSKLGFVGPAFQIKTRSPVSTYIPNWDVVAAVKAATQIQVHLGVLSQLFTSQFLIMNTPEPTLTPTIEAVGDHSRLGAMYAMVHEYHSLMNTNALHSSTSIISARSDSESSRIS